MEAKELRIGNLIMHIDMKTIVNYLDIENCRINSEGFNGIPLTEEWLKRAGFTLQSKNKYFCYKNSNGFVVCMWMEKNPTMGFEEFGKCYWGEDYVKIDYVHQLQNLYFALTGEELTFKTDKP